jgi:probable rRNA maturation factor
MIEVNNLTRFKLDEKRLKKIAEKILAKEKKSGVDLFVVFLGLSESQKLNKKYRKKDQATDVLSFAYKDSGEIVICPLTVAKNAKMSGEIFEAELIRVLIHGVLHVLGYDHEKNKKEEEKMLKKQEGYLKNLLTTKD